MYDNYKKEVTIASSLSYSGIVVVQINFLHSRCDVSCGKQSQIY